MSDESLGGFLKAVGYFILALVAWPLLLVILFTKATRNEVEYFFVVLTGVCIQFGWTYLMSEILLWLF